MFGTLMESRAARPSRTGASLASALLHGVLITGAVVATTRESLSAVARPTAVTVVYRPVRPVEQPRVVPRSPAAASVSRFAAPTLPRLDVPSVVPTTIPPIDLSRPVTPADFGDRRARGLAGGCSIECAAPLSITDGVASWTQADLMMQLRDVPVPPRYPEALRRAGIEGSVVARFTVDTAGRVDMQSIEIVRADHELFAQAVRPTLERLRFNPALVDGRKIRVLAQMPFHFTLKR